MSYLDKIRGILNEINISGETSNEEDNDENFTDDEDSAPEPTSDTSDDDGGDEDFMSDDSDEGSTDESGSDEGSDGGDEDFMGDDGGEAGGDESSDGGDEDFMGDDSSDEGSTDDSGGDESSDGGDEDFMGDDGGEAGGEGDESGDSGESGESSDEGEQENSEENNEEYDIEKIENELFSSLTPEQIAIKNHELKNQFIELYSIIGSTLVRINDISKSNDNINVLKFVTEKLLELREMIDFNITTAYQTRTYIENNIIYQQCIATLNAIAEIIDNIPKLDGKKNEDDEDVSDKGVPVEQDEESSESLEISDTSVTNFQEESYHYSSEYNSLF